MTRGIPGHSLLNRQKLTWHAGFAGSRSGALIATAWASLVHMGEAGYLRVTEEILEVGPDGVPAEAHWACKVQTGDSSPCLGCLDAAGSFVLWMKQHMSAVFQDNVLVK